MENVHVRPCRLRDTLKQYVEDQPPRPNSPIDTAAAANAFELAHLQKHLDREILREQQKENAEYDFEWYDEDGELATPSNDWKYASPYPLLLSYSNPLPKGNETGNADDDGPTQHP